MRNKKEHNGALLFALIILVSIIMLLTGCKTVEVSNKETTKTEQESETSESTVTNSMLEDKSKETTQNNTDQTKDSTSIESSKESVTDKDSGSVIIFGEGGGYFNVNTGEAGNVVKVEITNKERNLIKENQKYINENSSLKNELSTYKKNDITNKLIIKQLKDSLGRMEQNIKTDNYTKESTRNNWYWWFLTGLAIGVVGYFLISMYLKTNPIARFIKSWIK